VYKGSIIREYRNQNIVVPIVAHFKNTAYKVKSSSMTDFYLC